MSTEARITVETVIRIWFDGNGERIEVGDDRDGLDLNEIRYLDDAGRIAHAIVFPDAALPHVIAALQGRLARRGCENG